MAGPFSLGNLHFPTAVVPALSSKANSLFFFCSTAAIQLAKTTCRHWLLSSRRKRQHLWRIVINRLFLFHFGRLGGRACSCKKMKALRNWTYVSPADLIVPRATFHNSIFSRYIVKKKKNEIETLGFLYGRFRSRSTWWPTSIRPSVRRLFKSTNWAPETVIIKEKGRVGWEEPPKRMEMWQIWCRKWARRQKK